MESWRCVGCGHLLMRVDVGAGTSIEVQCHRCKAMNTIKTAILVLKEARFPEPRRA